MKKFAAAILCAMMVLTPLAGCSDNSSPASPDEAQSAPETAENTEADSTASEPEKSSDIVVGFSTGASGTAFRTIGTEEFKAVCEEYKAEGRIKDYKIVDNVTNFDANEQANIIRDFISDPSINVIVVNPNSPTDLNGVLSEAVELGKTVVVVDCEVDVEGVTCVSIDHYNWSKKSAEYICENLASGNIIQIYGGDGHPANNERIRATYDVLENYPDIKLVADTTGGWDNQVAKQATSQILGGGQQIDGVITQDSMAEGCLSAFMDLNKEPKVMFGECGTAYVKKWKKLRDAGSKMIVCTQPNPPSIVVSGLRVAVNLAEGKELKPEVLSGVNNATVYYDVKAWYTNDNFDELWDILSEMPDDYLLTESFSEAEALALFN